MTMKMTMMMMMMLMMIINADVADADDDDDDAYDYDDDNNNDDNDDDADDDDNDDDECGLGAVAGLFEASWGLWEPLGRLLETSWEPHGALLGPVGKFFGPKHDFRLIFQNNYKLRGPMLRRLKLKNRHLEGCQETSKIDSISDRILVQI